MLRKLFSAANLLTLAVLLYACCGCPPPPIAPYYELDTYYRTPGGADLLKSKTPNSFRQQDIQVTSKVTVSGGVVEVDYYKDYSRKGSVQVYSGKYNDLNDTSGNHILIYLPKGNQHPIETYVRLSPVIVDTITYTFGNGDQQVFPEKLFYNRKLIWDFTQLSNNQFTPQVTIIK